MKPDTEKALVAIHAQLGALMLQIESLIDPELECEPCPHENAVDCSTMGMEPGARRWCPDCRQYFSKTGG